MHTDAHLERLIYAAGGRVVGALYGSSKSPRYGTPTPPAWAAGRTDVLWRTWPPGFLAPTRGGVAAPRGISPDAWASARYGLTIVLPGIALLIAARDTGGLAALIARLPLGELRMPEFLAAATSDGLLLPAMNAAGKIRDAVSAGLRWRTRVEWAEVPGGGGAASGGAWITLPGDIVADAVSAGNCRRLGALSPTFLSYNVDSPLWAATLRALWSPDEWRTAVVVCSSSWSRPLVSAELAAHGISPGLVVSLPKRVALSLPPVRRLPVGVRRLRLLLLDGHNWGLGEALDVLEEYVSLPAVAAAGFQVVWGEDVDMGRGLVGHGLPGRGLSLPATTPPEPPFVPWPALTLLPIPLGAGVGAPVLPMGMFSFLRAAMEIPGAALQRWRARVRAEECTPEPVSPLICITTEEFAAGLAFEPGALVVGTRSDDFPSHVSAGWVQHRGHQIGAVAVEAAQGRNTRQNR